MSLPSFGSERCLGAGTGSINVFVLISYQQWSLNYNYIYVCPSWLDFFLFLEQLHRINKFGSQKDQEQKKNGNYFFYDAGEDDDDEDDFDDI